MLYKALLSPHMIMMYVFSLMVTYTFGRAVFIDHLHLVICLLLLLSTLLILRKTLLALDSKMELMKLLDEFEKKYKQTLKIGMKIRLEVTPTLKSLKTTKPIYIYTEVIGIGPIDYYKMIDGKLCNNGLAISSSGVIGDWIVDGTNNHRLSNLPNIILKYDGIESNKTIRNYFERNTEKQKLRGFYQNTKCEIIFLDYLNVISEDKKYNNIFDIFYLPLKNFKVKEVKILEEDDYKKEAGYLLVAKKFKDFSHGVKS